MVVERKTDIDYSISDIYGEAAEILRYDIESGEMRVFYPDIKTSSTVDIRITQDGVYRFGSIENNPVDNEYWGYTIVTKQIDDYIAAGLLRYRNVNPCEDCSSYDFCNLLIVMQTYYSIMFAVKNDLEYESTLSSTTVPLWVQQAAKLIDHAQLYILN